MDKKTGITMRAYYSYVALMHFAYGLRMPISVLWRLEQGLTLAEVGVLVAIFWVVLFVLEVPSGMIADRFGRKTAIAGGAVAAAASFVLMSVASSFSGFVIESIVSAAAFALTSGAGEAYLFDWLKERGIEKTYKKAWSRVMMLDEFATILGALSTSAILYWLTFEWSYRLGAATLALSAIVIIFFLRETKQHVHLEDNVIEEFEMDPLGSFQRAKNFLSSHRQFAGVFAAFALIEFPARILWQPQLIRIGFHESQMGLVYSVFKAFALLGAYVAGHKKQLKKFGFKFGEDQVITANTAAIAHLKRKNITTAFVIGTNEQKEEYERNGITVTHENAQAVLVSLDYDLDYAKLTVADYLLRKGADFIATNTDSHIVTPEGLLPDVAGTVGFLTATTGRTPEITGKPSKLMMDLVKERTDSDTTHMAIIGDNLDVDMQLAQDYDLISVLVLSGKTTREDLASSDYQPDYIVESVENLTPLFS